MGTRRVRLLVDRFDEGAPGANTDILTFLSEDQVTVAQPTGRANVRIAVQVQFANDTVFKAVVTRSTTVETRYNSAVDLVGGALYEFESDAVPGDVWDFQIETDGAIERFRVEEILEGSDA